MPLEQDSVSQLVSALNQIATERRNSHTHDIDTLSTLGVVERINHEDTLVANSITRELANIAKVVDAAVLSIQQGGRLIYQGAGTSGRLGILDAVECRPTFSVPDGVVVGVIAGGDTAIQHAVEGAEDDIEAGKSDLQGLSLNAKDTVIGLSASGRTPYVSGGLAYANSIGCSTGAIACSPNAAIFEHCDVSICPLVGPEALTGSTRMKAGSAQKMVLNMISTATMIKLGKVFGNLMVDVNATNDKLKARAVNIVMAATECDEVTAHQTLNLTNGQAKPAILMILTGCDAPSAFNRLQTNNGYLRQALQAPPTR